MDFLSVPQEDRQKLAGVIVSIYNDEKTPSMCTLYSESNGSLYFRVKDKKNKEKEVYIDGDLDDATLSNLNLELDLLSSVYQRLVMAEQYVEYEKIKQEDNPSVEIVDEGTTPNNPGQRFVDAVKSLGDVKPTAMLSTLVAGGAGEKFANALKGVIWISCTVLLTASRMLVPLTSLLGKAIGGVYKIFNTAGENLAKNLGVKAARKAAPLAADKVLAVQGVFANSASIISSVCSQLVVPVIITLTTAVTIRALSISTSRAASSNGFFPLLCLPSKANALPGYTDSWSVTLDCNDDTERGRTEEVRHTLGIGYFSNSDNKGDIASWYGYDNIDYVIPNNNFHYHIYPTNYCFPKSKGHPNYDNEIINAHRYFNHQQFNLFHGNDFVIPFASESSALAITSVMFGHDDAVRFTRLDDGLLFKDSAEAWRHVLANFCGFREKAGPEFLNSLVLEKRAKFSISGKDADTPRTYTASDYGHVPDFYAKRSTTFIDVPRELRNRHIDLPCCYATLVCYFSRCFTLVSEYTAWLYNTIKVLFSPCGESMYGDKHGELNAETEEYRGKIISSIHKYFDDTERADAIIQSFDDIHIRKKTIADYEPCREVWYKDYEYVDGLVSRFAVFYEAFLEYIDAADEFLFSGYENPKLQRKARGVLSTTYGSRDLRVYRDKRERKTFPSFPFCMLKGRYVDEFEFLDTMPFLEYETRLHDLKAVDQTFELFKGFRSDARNDNYRVLVNFGCEIREYRDTFYTNVARLTGLLTDPAYSRYYRDYLRGSNGA